MKRVAFVLVLAMLGSVPHLDASGPMGIYGIVEKVVFEPNEANAERIQVWGAFAYFDAAGASVPPVGGYHSLTVSPVRRGYMYFRVPTLDFATARQIQTIRNEWTDMKSVAGTGQAIGFGVWGYIGGFDGLRPDAPTNRQVPNIYEQSPGRPLTDLRVRPASEPPTAPALYETNAGIVKIAATGTHAAIVKQLQDALR